MRSQLSLSYRDLVSTDNLLLAWREFARGKRGKADVQAFARNLIDNILQLHKELSSKSYAHHGYNRFTISDPKPRLIHKAEVRDRLVHHAVYRQLYPFFDRTFAADSFSCRKGKGTHKAIDSLTSKSYRVSRNHTRTCWVLKCDIQRFFDSISHATLFDILDTRIADYEIRDLLRLIVRSFEMSAGKGLPLGNLTSQLLVNVYMNEFDQFVKHRLKAKHYVRYADDFVLLSDDRAWLEARLRPMRTFLSDRLQLTIHPGKIVLRTVASGIDYLGWVHFPHHRVLRATTKRRMFRHLRDNPTPEVLDSYLGLLSHGATHGLQEEVRNSYWLHAS